MTPTLLYKKINVTFILRSIRYRAVTMFRLVYENQSVNDT